MSLLLEAALGCVWLGCDFWKSYCELWAFEKLLWDVGFEKSKSHLVGHLWLLEKKLNGSQKSVKAGGEVLLDLYYEKSCF